MALGQRAVADLGIAVDPGFWRGRRVLVTGHTGFKGAWLCTLLLELGADVAGFAAGEPSGTSLFGMLDLGPRVESVGGDLRDPDEVGRGIDEARPDVVIHMGAQALVRRSYEDPVGTYATNVLGTANVLEAVRAHPSASAALVVTSDKCYRLPVDGTRCVEDDPLGGEDPYSSSKACAELVTAAYRESFASDGGPAIASARAGNVIGGGDWAADRLVPDAMRAALDGSGFAVRNPEAVRPWQHVLNPLAGYLSLVERISTDRAEAGPWNFGPEPADERTVRDVATAICELWGDGLAWDAVDAGGPAEARVLRIDSTKAQERLGWRPLWDLDAGLRATVSWFKRYRDGAGADATVEQARAYLAGSPPPV